MKVYVYRNLRTKGYSLLNYKTGKVIAHQDEVLLTDVEFRVRAGGRARARKDGQRNVHAFAIGFLVDFLPHFKKRRITYNPFQDETFVVKSSRKPIKNSKFCVLNSSGCFA